jgi:DNA-binding NarL/FixJ family response regulator
MDKIRILIAEDHKLIRETWAYILSSNPNFDVIATCSNAEDAVEQTKQLNPDIVLMDISILPFDGFEATERISSASPRTKVIGLSMHSQLSYVRKMFKSGASGYLTKNSSKEEMYNAILMVHGGGTFTCEEVELRSTLPATMEEAEGPDITRLTLREIQISHCIRDGYSSKEIAALLNLSLKTVEVHRHNILKKLKIKNATSLVKLVNMSEGYKV